MPAVSIKRALERPTTDPYKDAAPETLLDEQPNALAVDMFDVVGKENVLYSPLDIVRYATDASPYRLMPKVIVRPRDENDIKALAAYAHKHGRGLTFRAAGTSLNGQSQSDDILVDVRYHFNESEVLDGGARLRTLPGVVTARANALLSRQGRKLGPDPASSGAATLGGVLANNASGMTCGVKFNAYHTVSSVRLVLASGTTIDTGVADADGKFERDEPELYAEMLAIREAIRADKTLSERLRHKFSIKNTSGYHLDAFLDFDTPTKILEHLVVGSEGTLAFISDIVWNTLPFGKQHTTAFFRFPTLRSAASSVPGLNAAGANAVEILDAATLRSAKDVAGAPAWLKTLGDNDEDAAILTELRANDEAELEAFEKAAMGVVGDVIVSGDFTREAAEANGYWKVRSGLLAIVGAARPGGTSLITEDVAVPPERLADACADLEELLVKHGFAGAVNGHASAGNVHFYLYLDSTNPEQVNTYRAFMEDLVALICDKYDGSLKGEHGTGRNMAPYVEREWGEAAVAMMWRVKNALDPSTILGPGVFLNKDKDVTFKDLKSMPLVAEDLDPCIECGFCEPVCPSRHLSTTPRQRIALQRELARQGWDGALEERIVEQYEYSAVNTCAGDSSCAIACPVDIDTGHAMKRVRRDAYSHNAQNIGKSVAKNWGPISTSARGLVGTAGVMRHVITNKGLEAITGLGRKLLGEDLIPSWWPEMPGAAKPVPKTDSDQADAVFFAACINRIFGPSRNAEDNVNVTEALVRLAERAGKKLWIPDDISEDCCGTIWQSKGLESGNKLMAARVVDDLYRWSNGGELPIVVDASSCTLGVTQEVVAHLDEEHLAMHAKLKIYDAMTWAIENVVPTLPEHEKQSLAILHPTCSMNTLGIADELTQLAGEVADDVYVPINATCCATAGDRGFLHPELTESATIEEVAEISPLAGDVYLSGNRTCELGMEHDSGETYESVITALERATRPKATTK